MNYINRKVLSFSIIVMMSAFILSPLTAEAVFDQPVTAGGTVLVFGGRILDRLGNPVSNAAVEIWQTDERGIYDHPGDSSTSRKDTGFQFFGTSVSNSSGEYIFRTIIPGHYEPRPRHIHVKIKDSGSVLLTTQVYFLIDGATSGAGGNNRNLKMELEAVTDSESYTGEFDFVVDTGIKGNLKLTDRQSEGPYYPQKDLSLYDNDLASVD